MGSRTSAADLQPGWARWCVPSASDLIFVAMVGVLAFTNLSMRLLGDAGIGWHIRTGQMILARHAIPHLDPFSSSMGGRPWFAWEWLYDLLVGWLESAAGLNGVVLFTALIIACVFTWTFCMLLRRGTNILVAVTLVLLAASASMIHFLTRPHVVSWLFTLAWFRALESSDSDVEPGFENRETSSRKEQRGWLWLLPLLMVVWVNVHGGFLIGFALLGIYWCGAAWGWMQLTRARTESGFDAVLRKIWMGRRVRALTLSGVLSAAATFVNPYGWQLHVHIYRYLTNRFLMDHIDEFQSPNFHFVAQKCFAGLLLLALVAWSVKGRQVSASHGMVVMFAVYAGLFASRNIPVSSLLLILVIGPWLSDGMKRRVDRGMTGHRLRWMMFLQRMDSVELSLRGHAWPVAAIVLACWIAAHGGKLGAERLMDAHFSPQRFPVAAVDYLEKHSLENTSVDRSVLAPDYWGGYLIYRLYSRVRVVVDDRHDFYGEEFLKSYVKMVRLEPGWEDFLQQHPADWVLVPKDSALANILGESAGWQPIYRDDVAATFVQTRHGRP